jgi:uncharacterized membrane protein YkvA (DUF1232 family)
MKITHQKIRPWMFKKEILVLYYGFQDKRAGIWPKLTALLALIYLLNPLDIIPDFIPFFGYLDDLILVPLLLNLAVFLLPDAVREDSLVKASRSHKKFQTLIFCLILLTAVALIGIFLLIRNLININ